MANDNGVELDPETRDWTDAKVLIVDDTGSTVWELVRILDDAGFQQVQSTTNPDEAVYFYERYRPELLLLDLALDEPSTGEILKQISDATNETPPPAVIGLLGDETEDGVPENIADHGVHEFLDTPVDPLTVRLRVQNCLKRQFWDHLEESADGPVVVTEPSSADSEQAELDLLHLLARLIEFRDFETAKRGERVGSLAAQIARQLGLPTRQVHQLRQAAPLHDIGFVVVPDRVLLKRGRLTEEERKIIETHASNGARILATAQLPVLQLASRVARTHHERWDGTGYPEGLEGEDIPLVGRIVGVADAFAAMIHDRPYRDAKDPETALDEIRDGRGSQFDPQVVDALLELDAAGSLLPDSR